MTESKQSAAREGGQESGAAPARRALLNREALESVLREVSDERYRQHSKWGEQNHRDADHTSLAAFVDGAQAKLIVDTAAKLGSLSYLAILYEELCEAADEAKAGRPVELRAELVQCAAVIVAWIEAIDRRTA